MAASLSEIYSKRKLELEDITNRHKKAKGKEYFHPVQERLPSPSSPSLSLPHKPRQKSVSFELSRNEHYANLPLLTPKEDDYESCHEDEEEPAKPQQLDSNPDYVALGATADLLATTKAKIEDDLAELSELRKAAKFESKLALVDFYVRLICPDSSKSKSDGKASDLPQQHRIVAAPSVNWAKYHLGLPNNALSHDFTNDYEKVFKGLHMFPN